MPVNFEPQKTRSKSGFDKNSVKKVDLAGQFSNRFMLELNAFCNITP